MISFSLVIQPLYWNVLYHFWIVVLGSLAAYFVVFHRENIYPAYWFGFICRYIREVADRSSKKYVLGVLFAVYLIVVSLFVAGLLWLPFGLGACIALFFAWSGMFVGKVLREGKELCNEIRSQNTQAEATHEPSVQTEAIHEQPEPQLLDQVAKQNICKKLRDNVSYSIAGFHGNALYKVLAEGLTVRFLTEFVAPLFWLVVAGPIGLIVFIVIRTTHVLWNNPHYSEQKTVPFIWLLDKFMLYLPARISAYLLFFAAPLAHLPIHWAGWRYIALQAQPLVDKNIGWPIGTIAWIHGATLGGKTILEDGHVVMRPVFGPISGEWNYDRLARLIHHLQTAAILSVVVLLGLAMLLRAIF